jgi:hypothetical protein
VQTCRLHNDCGGQYQNDLHQRPGRENLVQQRHVMPPLRPIRHEDARNNGSTSSCPETQKSPMAIRPPGEMKGFIMDIPRDGATTMTPSFDGSNIMCWATPMDFAAQTSGSQRE